MKARLLLLSAPVLLAGCGEAAAPEFTIGGTALTWEMPEGFCVPGKDMAEWFQSVAEYNPDKTMLATPIACADKEATTPGSYIMVMTHGLPEKQALSRAQWLAGFKPNMDEKLFDQFLTGRKSFAELKTAAESEPGTPLGEDGNFFPQVSDSICKYAGGISSGGRPALTCTASIEGRLVIIEHTGYSGEDMMDMARRVRALAKSVKVKVVAS